MAAQSVQSFKFVHIPADVAEPIQQWSLELEPGKEVECLINRLKAHFSSTGPAKSAAQRAQQMQELLQNVPEDARGVVDPKMLELATAMNLVENIALLPQTRDNGYEGVNMYVDDEGGIKGLPRNMRASELAHCAGKPIEVKGDAFLARVFDNGEDFERRDFLVCEVSSDAPWVREAAAQHARQRAADTSGAALVERMRRAEQAADAAGTRGRVRELTPGEGAKEEGNAAFKRGNWQRAVECYTRALEFSPGLPAALNNRALALLKMQQWEAAAADCCAVLEQEPHNVKALLRRAAARQALQQQQGAEDDLREVLRLEPNNKEAAAKLEGLTGG